MKTPTAQLRIRRTLNPESDKWLTLAASKDERREWLQPVYGNISSDGYRLHHDTTRPFQCPPGMSQDDGELATKRFNIILDDCKNNKILATVKRDALILAALRAIAIGKAAGRRRGEITPLCLSFGGRLGCRAANEEIGETSGYIEAGYQHTGEDITIAFNPRLLIEVLSGLDEEIYISLRQSKCPALFTDGKREAVLMSMNIQ